MDKFQENLELIDCHISRRIPNTTYMCNVNFNRIIELCVECKKLEEEFRERCSKLIQTEKTNV